MRDEVQNWRELRNVRLSLLWYSVARHKQQENSLQQVKSARASPLAFSPIASQPRSFPYSPKMAKNAKYRFSLLWPWVARRKQQEKHLLASRVC